MKKRNLFISLAIALVLTAAMAVPVMAGDTGTTGITGDVPSTVEITAPSGITLASLVPSTTVTGTSGTAGTVNCNEASWTVTALDSTGSLAGYMLETTSGDKLSSLAAEFQISLDGGLTLADASTGITYTSSPETLPLDVSQVVPADAIAGSYSITITFTLIPD